MSSETPLTFTNSSTISIKSQSENNSFTFNFDKVFSPSTRQEDIFNDIALPIVESKNL